MTNSLSKLFKQTYNYPKTELTNSIFLAIEIKQDKDLRFKYLSYGLIGVLSLGGFIFVFSYTVKQLSASGFFQYVSLIFSDISVLNLYWKEYLMSLADSLPIASLGTSFFLLFSMFFSARRILEKHRIKLLAF